MIKKIYQTQYKFIYFRFRISKNGKNPSNIAHAYRKSRNSTCSQSENATSTLARTRQKQEDEDDDENAGFRRRGQGSNPRIETFIGREGPCIGNAPTMHFCIAASIMGR